MTAVKCDPRIQHQLERREESREQREERWAASEKHGAGIIGEMVRAPSPYKGTNFRHHSAVTRYSMAKPSPTTFTSCIWNYGGFARQKREGRSKKSSSKHLRKGYDSMAE